MSIQNRLEKSWQEALASFLDRDEAVTLFNSIEKEYQDKQIFPRSDNIFKAFELTPFSSVHVVVLGQDPYHGDNQAMGLSFSVPEGVRVPPSLKNIYKEIEQDLGIEKDMKNGNLESWARQGVLLLNTMLTVQAHTPASHRDKGWEKFTDTVIQAVSDKHEHIVFMLWGNYAQSKRRLIDEKKHLVLVAPHPSPLSSYTGFFGCKHFSKCNAYLKNHSKNEIEW